MGQFMTKQVFIAFAAEDVRQRDLLKGQSLNTNSTFDFVDMSVKQPYDSGWKSKTEARIKRSHGVIVWDCPRSGGPRVWIVDVSQAHACCCKQSHSEVR